MTDSPVGPYNLYDAIQKGLPKTLNTPEGHSLPFNPWFIQDELPRDPQPAFPHGVFSIIGTNSRNRSRMVHSDKVALTTPSDTDVIPFVSGTLDYFLENRDVAAVQSVTGTLSASPGHVFVEDTDFEVVDADDDPGSALDTIRWLSGGDVPDDSTSFTVVYTHKLYSRRWAMDSNATLRLIVKAQAKSLTSPTRHYQKSVLVQVLADDLETKMRRLSGTTLSIPAVSPTLLERAVQFGPFISGGPVFIDPSETMAAWRLDFSLILSKSYGDTAVEAIRALSFEHEASV